MAKKIGEKSEAILKAATEVFAETGYHNASISKIAKIAGIADGTIYLYFDNKEDILITLINETFFNQFFPLLEKNLSYFNDPKLLLFELVNTYFQFFGSDKNLSRVIQIEFRQSTPIIRAEIKQALIKHFSIIESVVRKGQEEGVFRTDVSVRDARKLIFGTMTETLTCWVFSSREYAVMTRMEATYKMLLQALIRLPSH
jgi:TetR/AcrR family fatty acid metabolism transcriptional regulator